MIAFADDEYVFVSLLVRDHTQLFVLDRREYIEITNGDQFPCVLLHTSKPLISIAQKYSILATSNILSLYILVHHIVLLLVTVTLSVMVMYLARTKRFL
jgi:hypothetical protein